MDQERIIAVAIAIHEAMRRSPYLQRWWASWDDLPAYVRSEYRAIAHSALIAAADTYTEG